MTLSRSLAAALLLSIATLARAEGPTLKDAFDGKFHVGVAVSARTLATPEDEALAKVAEQFNSISPENCLKWEECHPDPDRYDFADADRYVEFGERHGMKVIGHTLVWHQQTPAWVFQEANGQPPTRDAMLARLRAHIQTVVGRYRGRVHGWDVVNEALNEDGSLRDTPWLRVIGDDYLAIAFRLAQEADPTAELYYNDYNMASPAKRDGAVRLVEGLKKAGCRVDAIGMQGHWMLDGPSPDAIETSIKAFTQVTERVAITELDIDVLPRPDWVWGADVSARVAADPTMDPYRDGLPADAQQRLAQRYADVFRVLVRHADAIDRVTFWGLDDGRSWHNGWPVPGRTAHSLLFDRALRPKPAFTSVLREANGPAD